MENLFQTILVEAPQCM